MCCSTNRTRLRNEQSAGPLPSELHEPIMPHSSYGSLAGTLRIRTSKSTPARGDEEPFGFPPFGTPAWAVSPCLRLFLFAPCVVVAVTCDQLTTVNPSHD